MVKLLPIQEQIWNEKYRFLPNGNTGGMLPMIADETIEDSWRRIAKALAKPEKAADRSKWEKRFLGVLEGFQFLPGGRIIAGAGTGRSVTLHNCYVLGTIPDSMEGIMTRLKDAAMTMRQGGGIGMDFSTLRPKGDLVKGVGADASGPVSFMNLWNCMCQTVMSAGARRGAMMGTMRCDHPDIEAFIDAKRDPLRLRNFNVSVLVTDAFMEAVAAGFEWPLKFNGKIYRTVVARELWDKIMRSAYDSAEPGVIFIDRINRSNNLKYCETISATNPCAEQPLPPNGSCLLGSINLTSFIRNPFGFDVYFDAEAVQRVTRVAVRMLDNVIDVSNYPIPEQKREATEKRRIGLGITGLADALIMCGLHYGSPEACKTAAMWMDLITNSAYQASIDLAEEKGPFPLFEPELSSIYFDRDGARLRNSHLISIAPTGTISLLAGNVSSGIEPVYAWSYTRQILMPDGSRAPVHVKDYAVHLWSEAFGDRPLPPEFYARHDELSPKQHLAMQAAIQPRVDSSISKTVNCPRNLPFEDFQSLYIEAYKVGLKVCAAFRPNDITGAVLTVEPTSTECLVGKAENAATIIDEAKEPQTKIIAMLDAGQKRELVDLIHEASGLDKEGEAYVITKRKAKTAPSLPALSPRPTRMEGSTYKLKWPASEHAFYITINDDEEGRPYEVFINSKNLEHYSWTVALTRMVSAVFRRGGDISFVVEELKAVFDPKGGAWMGGKYVPSLLAAIGNIIEAHIGYSVNGNASNGQLSNAPEMAQPITETAFTSAIASLHDGSITQDYLARGRAQAPDHFCPRCGSANVYFLKANCLTCRNCNYSSCN